VFQRTIHIVILITIGCLSTSAVSQTRPAFCEPVPDALLGGLQAPYAQQRAPDGSIYCEGLLRNPIALEPPTVVSLKQDQRDDYTFVSGTTASIAWCDDSREPVHVRLRSIQSPLFALDAMQTGRFDWRADLIARWQPNWKQIAAIAFRDTQVEGRTYKILVPLRIGAGYSSLYSFTIQSKRPPHFKIALIEPIHPPSKLMVIDTSFSVGPSKDTWIATIPFDKMSTGIYRATFEEGVDQAGGATQPVYVLHQACDAR
jgi:hypothetical protein